MSYFHSVLDSAAIRRISLLLLLLWGCQQAHSSSKPTILVLGDSLSAAYGIDEHKGWVNLLREQIQQQGLAASIVNASISGETTAGGKSRLPSLLAMYKPDVVILELGGNDGLRGYPITSMRKQLQSAVDMSHASGARVLLLGMQIPPNYGQRYASMFSAVYRSIAQKNDIALVPFFLAGVATERPLMQADGIHPTAEAQPILLANVWPALQPLIADFQVAND